MVTIFLNSSDVLKLFFLFWCEKDMNYFYTTRREGTGSTYCDRRALSHGSPFSPTFTISSHDEVPNFPKEKRRHRARCLWEKHAATGHAVFAWWDRRASMTGRWCIGGCTVTDENRLSPGVFSFGTKYNKVGITVIFPFERRYWWFHIISCFFHIIDKIIKLSKKKKKMFLNISFKAKILIFFEALNVNIGALLH